jgi:predicted RNA-binding protein with PIN domain
MALVRILVDGYSLLHAWPELAEGKPRFSAAARDELIAILTQYNDACGIPISIFFDGASAPAGTPKPPSNRHVEVLYSKSGQTADDMIERTAHRMKPYGEALVITDDFTERDTVIALGGTAQSCDQFIRVLAQSLGEMKADIQTFNRRERTRFRRPH